MNLKQKTIVKITVFMAVAIIVLVGVVYAVGSMMIQPQMPQTADSPLNPVPDPTIAPTASPTPTQTQTPQTLTATYTINDAAWASGDSVAWGQLTSGVNTKTFSITNTGTVAISDISINSPGLNPWTETISGITFPIAPGATATGILTLTAEYNPAIYGSQSWTSTITVSSS